MCESLGLIPSTAKTKTWSYLSAVKTLDEVKHLFMTKALKKLDVEGTCLHITHTQL